MAIWLVLTFLLCAPDMLLSANVNRNSVVVMEAETLKLVSSLNGQSSPGTRQHTSLIKDGFDRKFENGRGKNTRVVDVDIGLDKFYNTIGPTFVGVTLDSSVFRREWKTFNVSSKLLQNLAKGLAPSYFRVGGTAADFFIFNTTGTSSADAASMNEDYDYSYDYIYDDDSYDDDSDFDGIQIQIKNYTVTGEQWTQLNNFVQEVGWQMIFDFNEFLRRGDQWDNTNARTLLTYSQERNFTIPYFQLGNEPNSYHHNFNFSIPASQLASDMQQLKTLLSEFPLYRNSTIIGPDVTKVTKQSGAVYLEDFLTKGGETVVSTVTLHHYYFNAKEHGVSVNDFVNITILDSLVQELFNGYYILHSFAPTLPMWFSETSSVSGGGLAGVSDGFAAGFMWLDKLGLSALFGLKAVLRQSFYNGNYALISHDFTPYPDYFLTVLYKRLVQGNVLLVNAPSNGALRVYANCANPASYPKGALTVYFMNVQNEAVTFNFTQFLDQKFDLFLLTAGDDVGLNSAYVALNGQKLVMQGEELPPLDPLICSGPLTFPAYSFGFVVIPQANVSLCQ